MRQAATREAATPPGRRPLWLVHLLACGGAAALYLALSPTGILPRWAPRALLYNGVALSSVLAVLIGIRRHRPSQPVAWYLIAAGLYCFALADLVFALLDPAVPSPAGVLYLASYPLVLAGVLMLVRRQSPGQDRATLVDALVVATAVGLLTWVFVLQPYAKATGMTTFERLVPAGYQVLDVLLLAMAVRLAAGAGARTPAVRLLTLSLVALPVSDTLYSVAHALGGYRIGSPIDAGWMLWYAGWGAAALHPSMRGLSEPAPTRSVRPPRWRLWLLAGASLMAPAVLALEAALGRVVEAQGASLLIPAVVGASAVLFLLVLVRMAGLARELQTQASERTRLLDRTVEAREEERIRVAGDLHDGPIQQLVSFGYAVARARLRLERGQVDGAEELLAGLERQISEEVEELRRLMTELRPPVLDEWGLPAALGDYGVAFQRHTKVRCTVEAELSTRLESTAETVLYRVAQEALVNVAKHANAEHARISLWEEGGLVRLRVWDDGAGFDMADLAAAPGSQRYGLASMRQRVETVHGALEISSRPGLGTTLLVAIPLVPRPQSAGRERVLSG